MNFHFRSKDKKVTSFGESNNKDGFIVNWLRRIFLFFTENIFFFISLKKCQESFLFSLNPLVVLSSRLLSPVFKTKARHQKHLIPLSRNINTKFYHNWQQRSKWPLTLLVKTRKDQFDTFPIRYGAISNVTEVKNCSSNVFLYHFEEEGEGTFVARNFINCKILDFC